MKHYDVKRAVQWLLYIEDMQGVHKLTGTIINEANFQRMQYGKMPFNKDTRGLFDVIDTYFSYLNMNDFTDLQNLNLKKEFETLVNYVSNQVHPKNTYKKFYNEGLKTYRVQTKSSPLHSKGFGIAAGVGILAGVAVLIYLIAGD